MDFYNRTHSSDLVMRLTALANAAGSVLTLVMTSFGRDLLTVIALVAVMLIQSPLMTAFTLLIGPPAIIGVSSLIKRIRDLSKEEFQSIGMIVSAIQETANNIRVVKAFNLEAVMRERITHSIESVRARRNKVADIKARTGPIMETLGGLAIAGIILWAGYMAIYYNEQPGAFMSFIAAVLLAYEPAKRLANTRLSLETGGVALRGLFDLLDTEPTMNANPDGPDIRIDRSEVVFKKVSFIYQRGPQVLREFDFRAAPGEVTALVGPSGSGKSTIINLIERFYDVDAGTIAVDGQDVATVRLASLREQMALVSQDVVLFRASIRDNIRFGRLDATDAEVEQAARDAMAHDFIMATEDGYDSMMDDGGPQLSGGQRQRIAIARAMLRDPRILLLDEATSSLDSESEHQVQIAFDRLMRGRTTIVIAHRLSTVLHADNICVIVDGELVEQGRHAELLALNKQYARFYRLQFAKRGKKKAAAGEPPVVAAAE